jgi:hypothetical protein
VRNERRSKPSSCTMHTLEGAKEKRGRRKLSGLVTRPNDSPKITFPLVTTHPTMFKRVDRRRKRKEKEERLGLDEDQLGVFGLHHTDSSESESDSSDSASTSSSDGLTTQSRKKRKREVSPPSYDEDEEDEDGEPATDDEEDEGDSDHGSHPLLTIASALKEPIRPDSDSETWVCVFCPGKTLKHAAMVKVHEASRVRTDYNHSVEYLH